MPTIDRTAKRRARRIAADEAHAWARNLRLNNPHAKLTLSMLSLYVDGDGFCFVAIPTLADDTELSAQTVRNRLAWLEQIGAIARLPQWIDEYGRRNGDAKGKRTSDLIRLMIDIDQGVIEAAAGGEAESVSREVSPLPQTGLNPEPETVSPAPALRQPYDSAEGLISEPEPESPPKAPSGGEREPESIGSQEPEHFAPAWAGWPGHEIMRRDLALVAFREMSAEKQMLCRAAVPLFAQLQIKLGRKHVTNFHSWIRNRGFDEFPHAKLVDASVPARRWICGDELAGLMVALRMTERVPPRMVEDPELGRGFWSTSAPRPDLAALAKFHDDDPLTWRTLERGAAQFAAWRDRLKLWLGGEIEPRKVFLETFDAAVHGVPHDHPDFKFRKSSTGLPVPAPWPPHRDGTWSSDNSEVA